MLTQEIVQILWKESEKLWRKQQNTEYNEGGTKPGQNIYAFDYVANTTLT